GVQTCALPIFVALPVSDATDDKDDAAEISDCTDEAKDDDDPAESNELLAALITALLMWLLAVLPDDAGADESCPEDEGIDEVCAADDGCEEESSDDECPAVTENK